MGVTEVSKGCCRGFTGVFHRCYRSCAEVLQGCRMFVAGFLRGVACVLQQQQHSKENVLKGKTRTPP
jgi:pantothenate kinase type III